MTIHFLVIPVADSGYQYLLGTDNSHKCESSCVIYESVRGTFQHITCVGLASPEILVIGLIATLTLRLLSAGGLDINHLYQCSVSR